MSQLYNRYHRQQGAILLVSLLLMLGMAVIAISSSDGMQVQKQLAVSNKMNKQAYQASSSGIEWSISSLNTNLLPLIAIQDDNINNFSNSGPFGQINNVENQIDIQRGKLFVPSGYSLNSDGGFQARIFELRSQAQVGAGDKQANSNQLQGVYLITPQN